MGVAALRFVSAIGAVALIVAACGGAVGPAQDRPAIRIGSTNFTEQLIVGELYAQALEAGGYKIERKFNLGAREVVVPALESGQIDLQVDYLATLLAFLDKNARGSTDAAETARTLEGKLKEKALVQFDFAPAVDQNGIVVTKETATRLGLRTVSDLAPVAKDLTFGGPPECPNREFCALGLEKVYGIKFKAFRPLDVGGPLTVTALEGRQIDVALLFTSDAVIAVKGFVLLEDDKKLQLSDNIVPILRKDIADRGGSDLRTRVDSVSRKLTTAELTDLNKQVGVDRKDPKDVARDWLRKQGLIT
jgi:osmoprotectant transport system substrate-binding protein